MTKEPTGKFQKIIKTGNSAALTIPSNFFKALNLGIGDSAVTFLDFYEGSVTYKFLDIRQLRLGNSPDVDFTKNPPAESIPLVKGQKNGKKTKS